MAISLLAQTIDQLSREKGIDPAIIVSALEDAMAVATRKYYRTEEEMRAQFDPKSGHVNVFVVKRVVEEITDPPGEITLEEASRLDSTAQVGGEILIPKPTDMLGRIAAQTAKQVILQKVREAEREIIYTEYHQRAGELLNVVVKRVEGNEVIIELGRYEARLPRREQSRLEAYNTGDRLRVILKEVDKAAKGAQVVVSRADAILVQRLFEMEVPEIYDATVVVKAIAREAGERTKIAVFSNDRDVDPVGACVGMKGMRVQSIIRELRGEKIDIIQWNEDIVQFATNALSPAKVARVSILDSGEKHLEVVVEDSQLSLAIGKKGQNVRLASKLIGWHIDIKSEEEKRQEIEAQMAGMMSASAATPLEKLTGVGKKTLERISAHGVASIEALAAMTPEQLMEIPGIGEKMVQKIAAAVAEHFESGEAEEAADVSEQTEEIAPSVEGDAPAELPAEEVAGTEEVTAEEVLPEEAVVEAPAETAVETPGQEEEAPDMSTQGEPPEEQTVVEPVEPDAKGSE